MNFILSYVYISVKTFDKNAAKNSEICGRTDKRVLTKRDFGYIMAS